MNVTRRFLSVLHKVPPPVENRPLECVRCFANKPGKHQSPEKKKHQHNRRRTEIYKMNVSDVRPDQMKSVRVAIVGPPNAGKSTLLNSLMQQEISPMSRHIQTTTGAVKGVITEDDTQVVFVDTPGLMYGDWKYSRKRHARDTYHQYHDTITDTLLTTDVIVYMMDVTLKPHNLFLWADFSRLFSSVPDIPVILVLNKIDRKQEEDKIQQVIKQLTTPLPILPEIPTIATRTDISPPPLTYEDKFTDGHSFRNIMQISALRGRNVEYVWYAIKECAVTRPWDYPSDTVSPDTIEDIVYSLVRAEVISQVGTAIGYRVEHTFVGYEENPNTNELLIEHAVFYHSKLFESDDDYDDFVAVLEKKLSSRFGLQVHLNLNLRFHKYKEPLDRFLGETSEIEIIED